MVNPLVKDVKRKREFSHLSDGFIEKHVSQFLSDNPGVKKALEEKGYDERTTAYKKAVKEVRAKLRTAYGMFRTESRLEERKRMEDYLNASKEGKEEALQKLLDTHRSTKERAGRYKELYEKIFSVTGTPRHVLDLGCGFNPFSYPLLGGTPKYTCCDVSEEDMDLVNEFFEKAGIDGEALVLDLEDPDNHEKLKDVQADVAFLFKLVDTLESQRRDVTKHLITTLMEHQTLKSLVVSFSLRSLSGRAFRQGGKENWFTRFLQQQDLKPSRITLANEEFYVIPLEE
ncbi:hypothetical protein KY327_03260 [Candidatus Woesearchaeota archaeon]|nr:hypothetical protein [Candidatus Woesearchaeota archaeon]